MRSHRPYRCPRRGSLGYPEDGTRGAIATAGRSIESRGPRLFREAVRTLRRGWHLYANRKGRKPDQVRRSRQRGEGAAPRMRNRCGASTGSYATCATSSPISTMCIRNSAAAPPSRRCCRSWCPNYRKSLSSSRKAGRRGCSMSTGYLSRRERRRGIICSLRAFWPMGAATEEAGDPSSATPNSLIMVARFGQQPSDAPRSTAALRPQSFRRRR